DDDFLSMLVDHGLLIHDGAPPLVGPPPLLWMAARHPHWGEVAAQLAAPSPKTIGAVAEPLHAVLVHEGAVTLARAAGARAAAALAAVAPPIATRPTFGLMLARMRGRRGAAPGDGWLLGLHAPAGATWGRFAHALGAPLFEAMAPLADAAVDVDYAPSPRLG